MKIAKVTDETILFDNGNEITFAHEQDCCEWNYADFENIDTVARNTDFDPDLQFEVTDGGFRFGNKPYKMFFVPCYSVQNGYYTRNIDIFYNGNIVLWFDAEWVEN